LHSKELAYPKTGGISHGKVKVTLKSDTFAGKGGYAPEESPIPFYFVLEGNPDWASVVCPVLG
jgi:hypothetical protein